MSVCEKDRGDQKDQKDYDTIVLSGGGVKGYALLGAVQCLIDKNLFGQVTNFYGTSVGAIIGYLLAIGYSPIEITIFLHVNKITENLKHFNINMMTIGEGAINFSIIAETLEKMTLEKIGKLLTLETLKKEYKKRLVCCTYNMTICKTEYLSPENSPDLPCLIALRMTANIPLVFSRFKYMENYYVDGGISDNFPIVNASQAQETKNIVGVYIDVSEQSMKDEPSEGIISYFLKLLQIPLIQSTKFKIENVEKMSKENKTGEKCDIIRIITKDIKNAVDFHVDSRTSLEIFSVGYNSAKSFLESQVS